MPGGFTHEAEGMQGNLHGTSTSSKANNSMNQEGSHRVYFLPGAQMQLR